MKILLRILGTLALILSLMICSVSAWRNFRDADAVAKFETEMTAKKAEVETLKKNIETMPDGEMKASLQQQIADGEAMIKEIPSKSSFTISGILLIVLGIISFIGGILLFVPKPVAKMIFIAAAAVSLLAYFLAPDVKASMTGGATNRYLAVVSAVPAILCTLFAFLIARKSAVKA